MKIKVKYEDKVYDATVVGDHKVLIHGYTVDLYQQEGTAQIDIYLDQCLHCGVWLSEEDGCYGDGYCDKCAALCIECERYDNAADMIPPKEDGGEHICKECAKKPEVQLLIAFNVRVGDRVESISPIDRYPHFLFEEKIIGTVELMNDGGDLMVKVDKYYPELDEWDNCLTYINDEDMETGFLGAWFTEFKLQR